jgi:hypothetical protein
VWRHRCLKKKCVYARVNDRLEIGELGSRVVTGVSRSSTQTPKFRVLSLLLRGGTRNLQGTYERGAYFPEQQLAMAWELACGGAFSFLNDLALLKKFLQLL